MEVKSLTEQKSLLEVLPPGKRARLHRLLFEFGPGNGTLMLLPIDQGIEHGPRDFFPNPASKNPDYQRQDRRPPFRRRPLDHQRLGRGRGAAWRRCGRLHPLRRLSAPG